MVREMVRVLAVEIICSDCGSTFEIKSADFADGLIVLSPSFPAGLHICV